MPCIILSNAVNNIGGGEIMENKQNSKKEPAFFPPHKSHLPFIEAKALLAEERKSNTDILGSYTGVPVMNEYPEQDPDDL